MRASSATATCCCHQGIGFLRTRAKRRVVAQFCVVPEGEELGSNILSLDCEAVLAGSRIRFVAPCLKRKETETGRNVESALSRSGSVR
jgi:hypothetical protein